MKLALKIKKTKIYKTLIIINYEFLIISVTTIIINIVQLVIYKLKIKIYYCNKVFSAIQIKNNILIDIYH
jgi:hypothetical protein